MKLHYRALLLSLCSAVLVALVSGCSEKDAAQYVTDAEQLINQQEYSAAIIQLKNALRQDPNSANARWLLGNIHLKFERGADAEKELLFARKLGVGEDAVLPALAEALVIQGKADAVLSLPASEALSDRSMSDLLAMRALAKLRVGEIASALEEAEAALRRDPKSFHAKYARALLYVEDGNTQNAMPLLEEVTTQNEFYTRAHILKARVFRQDEKLGKAEEALGMALKANPTSYLGLINRAQIRLMQSDAKGADKDLASLKSLGFETLGTKYTTGLSSFMQANYDQAASSFDKVLQQQSNHLLSNYLRAMSHYLLGNREQAVSGTQTLLSIAPNFIPGRLLLARMELENQNGAAVVQLLGPVYKVRQDNEEVANILAAGLMMEGEHDDALAILQELVDESPESKKRLASGLVIAGKAEEALSLFSEATEHNELGEVYAESFVRAKLQTKSVSEALSVAEELVAQSPDSGSMHHLLGLARHANNDRDGAKSAFERALDLDPGHPTSSVNLAGFLVLEGDIQGATDLLERSIAAYPDFVETRLRLVELALSQEQTGEAVEQLIEVVRIDPDYDEAKLLLADQYLIQERPAEALRLLDGLSDQSKSTAAGLDRLSRAKLMNGDVLPALTAFESLRDAAPENVSVRMRLMGIYELIGQVEKMRQEVDAVLELEPDNKPGNLARARLAIGDDDLQTAKAILHRFKTDGTDPSYIQAEALLAAREGDTAGAYELYTTLLEQRPSILNVIQVSRAAVRAGQRAEAVAVLEEWSAKRPENIALLVELSNLRVLMEQRSQAALVQRRILELDQTNVYALNNLAWGLRNEEPQKALAYADLASGRAPDSSAVLDTLAMVQAANGMFEQALSTNARAISIDESMEELRLHRAEIYLMAGEQELAEAVITQLLASSQDTEIKERARELLSR